MSRNLGKRSSLALALILALACPALAQEMERSGGSKPTPPEMEELDRMGKPEREPGAGPGGGEESGRHFEAKKRERLIQALHLDEATRSRLNQRLEQLGYPAYTEGQAANQSLEAYPHACFTTLLGHIPLPKHTLEGRLQRQLILHEIGLHIPDPMLVFEEITRYRLLQGILPLDSLYSPQELDALVAAYTAWMAGTKPGQVTLLGDAEEGFLILPAVEIKGRY